MYNNWLFALCSSVLSNHAANNHYGRFELESPSYQTAASLQPLHENSRQEKIEVQILPQVSLRTKLLPPQMTLNMKCDDENCMHFIALTEADVQCALSLLCHQRQIIWDIERDVSY